MKKQQELLEKIKRLPHKPGIYMLKTKDNKILYIGKAKNLKNRVSSYFQRSQKINEKIKALASKTEDFDIIITDNETEALILENNLIKKYKPPFNIELKENERYPYIKITNEVFPRIQKTRIKKKDDAYYFGPYPGVKAVNNTLKIITDIFPIRRCSRKIDKQNFTPCLNYHLGKCKSPCSGKISSEEYMKIVNQVILFLKGQKKSLIESINREMKEASRDLKFEYAIELRDRLKTLKSIFDEQKITLNNENNTDIIGLSSNNEYINITVLIRRDNKIIGKKDYNFPIILDEIETFNQFLERYYSDIDDLPEYVIIPFKTENTSILEKYILKKSGKKIIFTTPRSKTDEKLILMAEKNASYKLSEKEFEYNPEDSLSSLKEILSLESRPEIIEGFDIANLLGKLAVASMVCFKNGIPYKKSYRRYKIRYTRGPNDVEMIKEVVSRRYQRVINEDKRLPDLILIDGGIPQVNAAKEVLDKLGINKPVVGLAKKEEKIFTPNNNHPIQLPKRSEALRLLMAVRDEAHRFANTYHFKLREKEKLSSELEKIKGIGKNKAQKILSFINDLTNGLNSLNIEKISGIKERYTEEIYNILKKVIQ